MRILVTGSNGFVGKYLREEIESRGHDFIGLDRESNDKITCICDIRDAECIKKKVNEIVPDIVIHLAGIARVDYKDPGIMYSINTTGTLNLAAALPEEVKFLYISSSLVYGNVSEDQLPIEETTPVNPVNHYGASKAAAENIIKSFICERGIQSVIVRPFNHTGVGQTDDFVVPKIVNAFKRRDSSITLGNISTKRDFLDVRDVVKAYMDIAENFRPGEIYNVSSGKEVMISDIIAELQKITGHNIKIENANYLERKSEILSVVGSSEKIQNELNWKPRYSIEDTLQWMIKEI